MHVVLLSIISYHSTQLSSKFYGNLHEKLGMQLTFRTTFYPQTNGQSKRIIQVLEGMLKARVIDFDVHWNKFLPLYVFSYNKSYYFSINMVHLKLCIKEGVDHP